jgi:hypothetical protein
LDEADGGEAEKLRGQHRLDLDHCFITLVCNVIKLNFLYIFS